MSLPRFWRWEAETQQAYRIEFALPMRVESELGEGLEVPELTGLPILTAFEAPDGWRFHRYGDRRPGLLGGVLFGGRNRGPHLRSGSAVTDLDLRGHYSFVGWIVGEPSERKNDALAEIQRIAAEHGLSRGGGRSGARRARCAGSITRACHAGTPSGRGRP